MLAARKDARLEAQDWADATQAGNAKADALIAKMIDEDNPTYLGRAVEAMVKGGIYGGVEVGFFHRISERLMLG